MPDYSNTIIYKISCKDPTISGIYVGHTTDFTKRKYSHMKSSLDTNNMILLYRTIRLYGGWDNWEMKIIGFFDCENLTEAREKEQEFYLSLNANLNSVEPFPSRKHTTDANNYIDKKEVAEEATQSVVEEAAKEPTKEATEMAVETITEEIGKKVVVGDKYLCKACEYSCNNKTNFFKHKQTTKHINNINKIVQQPRRYSCLCGNTYKYHQGLSLHKKTCQAVDNVPGLTRMVIELVKTNQQLVESQRESQAKTQELQKQIQTFMNKQNK